MRGGWPDMSIMTSQGITNAWSGYDMCLCVARYVWVWQVTCECEAAAQSDELTGRHSRVKPGLRCRGGLGFYLLWCFLSQFLDCDHGECQFYGMQGFSPLSSSLVLLFALHWNRPFGNKPSLVVSPPQWFSFGFIKRISSSSSICPLSQGIDWYLLI